MNNLMLVLLMACGGVAIALQPSINARLAQKVGSFESSLISFAVGTLCLLAVVLTTGRGSLRGVVDASWWELTGGFLGAFFVTMTIIAVPRMGTAAVMAIIIAGQLSTGTLLDHLGMFGLRQVPLTPLRGVGIALLCLGAALVVRR
ncbi:DMT family transporter [Trichlorobacter ammonificans]|uniref:Inner membrane protein YdcZ n=1 Tax=Trichlorobacter ammonificans TaxID=2916410 RepID=A0ABM9DBE9_9BACT|nr:DMT family transporter [Trichlorobacter ammonificans]CAH2032566.1 putative Inner membrane protein YdcZ [Trichlorobacter ammonificans]